MSQPGQGSGLQISILQAGPEIDVNRSGDMVESSPVDQAGILQIVPLCGAMVSGIWALVCLCIGLSKTQEISVGKAVFAVLLPTVVCCVGVVVIAGAVFGAVMAAQSGSH